MSNAHDQSQASIQADHHYMGLALDAAKVAADAGEVPVGAVVVAPDGRVLSVAANRSIAAHDPSAHAEICALREAGAALGNYRLTGCTLYVTLEPCAMCAGAIAHARVARLVYGADDPKGGAVAHGIRFFDAPTCHHRPHCDNGLRGDEASQLLKRFFQARRA